MSIEVNQDAKCKFIFYAGFSDYWKVANYDLYKNDRVFVCEGISNNLLDRVNKIHNSWRLNQHLEMPLKSLWFSSYSSAKWLDKETKQTAIFPEDNSLSFSGKYLRYLRKHYPQLVIIFNFSNPCGQYNLQKLKSVKQYYDHIITFNEADSKKYGFELLSINGYSCVDIPDSNIPESDLFFVGQDKGRLPILLAIYERMTSLGLKCDFSIVKVNDENIVSKEGIVYNRRMTYMEVLQHVKKSKCVLELLEGDSDYSSIRTSEALTYHKKLITMSPSVINSKYYSPSQMLLIKAPEDISNSFFEMPIENKYDITDYSPIKGLTEIAKLERTKP